MVMKNNVFSMLLLTVVALSGISVNAGVNGKLSKAKTTINNNRVATGAIFTTFVFAALFGIQLKKNTDNKVNGDAKAYQENLIQVIKTYGDKFNALLEKQNLVTEMKKNLNNLSKDNDKDKNKENINKLNGTLKKAQEELKNSSAQLQNFVNGVVEEKAKDNEENVKPKNDDDEESN